MNKLVLPNITTQINDNIKAIARIEMLILPNIFPTLNEVIEMSKRHWADYSKTKASYTMIVKAAAKEQEFTVNIPAIFTFKWFCKDKRKDPDNVASACKFIMDGLVSAGILENDGWKQVSEIHHLFFLDKSNPRIEVTTKEISHDTV